MSATGNQRSAPEKGSEGVPATDLSEVVAHDRLAPAASPADLTAPLTVGLVMARYGLRDRRAARRLMDEAGAFRMGAGLYVRLEYLIALEERQKARRAASLLPAPARTIRRAPAPVEPGRPQDRPLAPGWWREGAQGSCGSPQGAQG